VRHAYVLPVDSFVTGTVPLVDHAKGKLLYNELAPLYDLAVWRDTRREVEGLLSLIRRFRPTSRTVLDLGCGVGRHAGALSAIGFSVTGVDLSPAMLAVARRRNPTCRFVTGDFRSIRLRAAFDVAIIMWTTFNYLGSNEDIDAFSETVSANLANDGLLIVDVANYAAQSRDAYERQHANTHHVLRLQIVKHVYRGYNVGLYSYRIRDLLTGESVDCIDQEIARVYRVDELMNFGASAFTVEGVFGDYDLSDFTDSRSPRILIAYRHRADKQSERIQ
jgi:SAM-dependent methyltransferase